MAIEKRRICLTNIMQGDANCVNPTITWTNLRGLINPCIVDGNCIEVELIEGAKEHCLTIIIDCEDCDQCPPVYKDICFCDENGTCPGCHTCNPDTGICDPICPDQDCCDGVCCDCTDDDDCPTGEICINGKCGCPPGQKRCPDGICKECCDSTDCDPCYECVGGSCVPIDCPTGFCDPSSGECVECYDGSQCGPNECCKDNKCVCCEGFYRDENGNCVPSPKCFGDEDCPGDCQCCDNGNCVPCPCPPGQVCVDGECVDSCCEPGQTCPDGYGCINCVCIPCSELSCDDTGLQCAQAAGCECDSDNNCVPVDCSCDAVGVNVEYTAPIPGQPINPGLPPLSGTLSTECLGLVGGVQNHRFNVSVDGNPQGTWTAYEYFGAPGVNMGSGSTSSVTQAQLNMTFGVIEIRFTEINTGRTISFYASPNFGSDLSDCGNWGYEVESNGTSGTFSPGTPGKLLACPTNADFEFTLPVTGTSTQGDLNPTFVPDENGCLRIVLSGCGIWEGTIPATCGGNVVCDVPIILEQEGCCDPLTEPDCPFGGGGGGCEGDTIVPIELSNSPYFEPDTGRHVIQADFQGAGLTRQDWFTLRIKPSCWSTSANNGVNDMTIEASNDGTYARVNVAAGGCIQLGYSCDLRLSGCRKLQGELCLEACSLFEVDIRETGNPMEYEALVSSFSNLDSGTRISYNWTNENGISLGSTKVFTVPNNTPLTKLCVRAIATIGQTSCVDEDCIELNIDIPGCMSNAPEVCNFDPNATTDLGCVTVPVQLEYECSSGLAYPQIQAPQGTVVQLFYGTQLLDPNGVNPLPAGERTIDIHINGEFSCDRTLIVPTCYACDPNTNDCVASGDNLGTLDSTCGGTCARDIELDAAVECLNGNQILLKIDIDGGTNPYTVRAYRSDDPSKSNLFDPYQFEPANTPAQTLTPPFCPPANKNVTIEVEEGGGAIQTYQVPAGQTNGCCECYYSPMRITFDSYNNSTVFFSITPDTCATSYQVVVRRKNNDGSLGGIIAEKPATKTTSSIFIEGGLTAGSYRLQILSTGTHCNCTKHADFTIDEDGGVTDCELNDGSSEVTISLLVASNLAIVRGFDFEPDTNYQVGFYVKSPCSQSECSGGDISPDDIRSNYAFIFESEPRLTSSDGRFSYVADLQNFTSNTCYGVIVYRSDNDSCETGACIYLQSNEPSGDPNLTIQDPVIFNSGTNSIPLCWEGQDLIGDNVEVIVQQSSGPVANPCTDPEIETEEVSGESGCGEYEVTPGLGQDTQVTITIFDSANPQGFDPCSPSGVFDQRIVDVPGCGCDWDIVDVQYANDQLQIELDVNCAPNLDDVEIHFDQWTGPGCTGTETVDALTPITGITQQQAEGSLIFVPLPSSSTERFYKIRLEDATATPGCSAEQCVTVEACDCSFQVTNISFNQATLQVTVTTNISGCNLTDMIFGFADANGVLSVEENSTIPAVAGITQTAWTLTSLPQGGTLGVTVSNANELTCAGTNTIQICDVVDPLDGDPAEGGFTQETNPVYSSKGALVFENPGLLSYNWVGTGSPSDGSGEWTLDYPTSAGQIGTPAQGQGSPFGMLENITGQNGTVLNNALWTGANGPNLRGQGLWVDGIDANTGSLSHCLNVSSAGTYYLAFSADNAGTLKVNNVTVIDLQSNGQGLSQGQQPPFLYTWLIPIQLSAGNNNIEVDFQNFGATDNAVHFAVYNNTYAEIVGGTALVPLVDTSSAGSTFGLTVDESLNVPGGKKCPPEQPYPVYQVDSNGCVLKCTDCEPDNS